MKKKVVIIDNGIGNLKSVCRAFEKLDAEAILVRTPDELTSADFMVLPGVGAFNQGMSELKQNNLDQIVYEHCRKGRPFLGICLGMQMLADSSEEFTASSGLSLIPGRVIKIPGNDSSGRKIRIPHIGWNSLQFTRQKNQNELFCDIPEETDFYFVHSYYFDLADERFSYAYTEYNRIRLTAVVKRDNIWGCQFHPEKSGKSGLHLLWNFLNKC